METRRALHVSQRVYKALLLTYPKKFREEYGPHMAQVFGDLSREEYRRGGADGLASLWMRAFLDLVITALTERSRTAGRRLSYLGGRFLTLRRLLLINAVVLLVCGLALTNVPVITELYGFAPPPTGSPNPGDWAGMAFARLFGVTCLTFGLLLWAVSRVAETEVRQAVSGVLFLANMFGVLLLLGQQMEIWLSMVGWITVVVHLFFALGYGSFWLRSFRTLAPPPTDGRATVGSLSDGDTSEKASGAIPQYRYTAGSPERGE